MRMGPLARGRPAGRPLGELSAASCQNSAGRILQFIAFDGVARARSCSAGSHVLGRVCLCVQVSWWRAGGGRSNMQRVLPVFCVPLGEIPSRNCHTRAELGASCAIYLGEGQILRERYWIRAAGARSCPSKPRGRPGGRPDAGESGRPAGRPERQTKRLPADGAPVWKPIKTIGRRWQANKRHGNLLGAKGAKKCGPQTRAARGARTRARASRTGERNQIN